MNRSLVVDVLFWCFAAGSVVAGYLVPTGGDAAGSEEDA